MCRLFLIFAVLIYDNVGIHIVGPTSSMKHNSSVFPVIITIQESTVNKIQFTELFS